MTQRHIQLQNGSEFSPSTHSNIFVYKIYLNTFKITKRPNIQLVQHTTVHRIQCTGQSMFQTGFTHKHAAIAQETLLIATSKFYGGIQLFRGSVRGHVNTCPNGLVTVFHSDKVQLLLFISVYLVILSEWPHPSLRRILQRLPADQWRV